MTKQPYILTEKDFPGCWFGSYGGKYMLADNLSTPTMQVLAHEPFYNQIYAIMFVVQKGALHMTVDGIHLELKSNDYLIIAPCTTIQIEESNARFICQMVLAHLMIENYTRMDLVFCLNWNSFCFHYYHIKANQRERFVAIYDMMKREMQRKDYRMKEFVFRSYVSLYLLNGREVHRSTVEEKCYPDTRQRQLFEQFLKLLNENYKLHRDVQFYANELQVSSKYLSLITHKYALDTASSIIDNFVAFHIKLLLYENTYNVKQISEKLNFPTQSFFGRYFKRIVGCSPRHFVLNYSRSTVGNSTEVSS